MNWPDRKNFARAYFHSSGAILLKQEELWAMYCGPFSYGPYGKVGLPYYVEICLKEWPIRLKCNLQNQLENWEAFVKNRQWEANYLADINEHINTFVNDFPCTKEQLESLLLSYILGMIEHGEHHRIRYAGILALEHFGELAKQAIPLLLNAKNDEHGSVRQAAHILLKSWDIK